jgi:hypothetical protein
MAMEGSLTGWRRRLPWGVMKFAKVRFESDDVCAQALKGLAARMRITVLADVTFIVPEAGMQWLTAEKLPFQVIEWVTQDYVVQALRDNLTHPVQ